METKHNLRCEAPICAGDPNPKYKKEVVWRPGELVCARKPYEEFQKVQLEINSLVKMGKFKNVDQAYTVSRRDGKDRNTTMPLVENSLPKNG